MITNSATSQNGREKKTLTWPDPGHIITQIIQQNG